MAQVNHTRTEDKFRNNAARKPCVRIGTNDIAFESIYASAAQDTTVARHGDILQEDKRRQIGIGSVEQYQSQYVGEQKSLDVHHGTHAVGVTVLHRGWRMRKQTITRW